MMMTELMFGRTAADEVFAGVICEMPGRSVEDLSQKLSSRSVDCERLATMTMPELLYYVVVGRKEKPDELA